MDMIKVIAPKDSPHVCYIPVDRREKIQVLRKKTGKSLYRILCLSSGVELSTKTQIKSFKTKLRKLGYSTIGEWATELIDLLYEKAENLTPDSDIPCVVVSAKEEE